ncbi:hypothetical protein GQ457_02G020680 [Hibiscus cannabinus]
MIVVVPVPKLLVVEKFVFIGRFNVSFTLGLGSMTMEVSSGLSTFLAVYLQTDLECRVGFESLGTRTDLEFSGGLGYQKWVFHGEPPGRSASTSNPTYPQSFQHRSVREDDMEGMLRDAFNMHTQHEHVEEANWDFGANDFTKIGQSGCDEEPNEEATKFYKLLNEMNEQLYKGSKHSKLSFCVRLFHLKCMGGWIDNSFT